MTPKHQVIIGILLTAIALGGFAMMVVFAVTDGPRGFLSGFDRGMLKFPRFSGQAERSR
jgi:hypothetical protein